MNDIDQVLHRLREADPAPVAFEISRTDSWTVLIDTIQERSGKMQQTAANPWWKRGPAIAAAVIVLILGAGAVFLTMDSGDSTEVAAPTVTTTLPAATTPEVIEVTFDGTQCTVDGPREVPAGDRIFVFKDLSDLYTDFNVSAYSDGNTFQDVVDAQNDAGGPGAYVDDRVFGSAALYSFALLDIDLAENESAHRYDLEPGEHGMWLWSPDPLRNWLCGPLTVTEP